MYERKTQLISRPGFAAPLKTGSALGAVTGVVSSIWNFAAETERRKGELAAQQAQQPAPSGGMPDWVLPVVLVGGAAGLFFLLRKK